MYNMHGNNGIINALEILYTRYLMGKKQFESMRATRTNKSAPFGKPERIQNIIGFSEAPAFNHNEDLIYYHKKSMSDGKFRIHVLHRNKDVQ